MAVLFPPVDTVRFSTSWAFNAFILSIIRIIFSLYIFSALIAILARLGHYHPDKVGHQFSYFTSLSFWGLAFYFAVSAFHSVTYWWHGRPALAAWPKWLQQLHSLYYTTITVYPFIVTVVFWILIFDYFYNSWDMYTNVSQHALNSVFALFEIVFCRADPPPWIHLLFLLIMLAMYVGVAYITFATEGFFVYTFLDDRKEGGRARVTGWVFAILAITLVVYVITRYVIFARKWIVERKRGITGRLETRSAARHRPADVYAHDEPKP